MNPGRFALFVVLAFFAVSVYLVVLALWNVAIGNFLHSRFLNTVLGTLAPVAIGLTAAGRLGAWRPNTHLAYKALAVIASGLMSYPASLAIAHLGIMVCGFTNGCFN